MEQRRFLLFVALSMTVFIGWYAIVLPAILPPQPAKQQAEADAPKPADAKPGDARPGADDADPQPGDPLAEADDPAVKPGPDDGPAEIPADDQPAPEPEHPSRTVHLGSLDPDSGYFQRATLTARRGAVAAIALNDPRYRELTDHDAPLRVLGSSPSLSTLRARLADAKVGGLREITRHREVPHPIEQPERTLVHEPAAGGALLLRFDHELQEAERERITDRLDEALARTPDTLELKLFEIVDGKPVVRSLAGRNWEVVETQADPANPGITNSVTFALKTTDGRIAVRKRFWLEPVDPAKVDLDRARGEQADGYTLEFELAIVNLAREPIAVAYELQGPVGVPLEDRDNARKYRDVKGAFFDGDSIDTATIPASTVVSRHDDNSLAKWTDPVKYVGIDVQYFVALVIPRGDPAGDPHLEHAEPELIARDPGGTTKYSDISVTLTSRTLDLKPGKSAVHAYGLFAGPKNRDVLASAGAGDVIDFGWFPLGRALTKLIANALLSVLILLHSIGLPYGIAIIGLTVIVRAAMFPISLKQHRSMQTMKELQPKIKELQTRYANDREKLGRAMMEMYAEHNYNPLAGCLPMLLQLPIFLGLYQALGNAVELRMAPFLWADNLAAPDALFDLPFTVPFVGWTTFNLLPILTIGLFIAQQKMFMPPPTDEQQAAQQKMMKYMMVFMGFLFYTVPAGLCIYFIASSLWGMGERQLLGAGKSTPTPPVPAGDAGDDPPRKGRGDTDGGRGGGGRGGRGGKDGSNGDGKGGFLGRLLEKADAAANPNAPGGSAGPGPPKERKSRKDKGKRKTRR
jgi:YidC/Oxa1 family membrane protein insertase